MKIYAIIFTLFLIVGCAHLSDNSSAVNIDGTWRGEVEVELGKQGQPHMKFTTYITFNFKREGDTIKGTVSGRPGEWIPLEDIKIKGKKIFFEVTTMMGPNEIKTKYTGKIEGEKIKMSIKTELPDAFIGPGSPNPRFVELHNRSKGEPMAGRVGRDVNQGMVDHGLINSVGGVYGVSKPGNPTRTHKVTVKRISKIPENPVNQ